MRQYDSSTLVIHPNISKASNLIVEVRRDQVGWETIDFEVRKLSEGESWQTGVQNEEIAIVQLGGEFAAKSNRGEWPRIGVRKNVFSGLPFALYLPRESEVQISALSDCEFALAKAPAEMDFPAKLITPKEVKMEIRGGDHATRQINDIIPPGFKCQRLVVVEVYTPGGNWSSYPPHKHDNRRVDQNGNLLEADLDEIYYYKIDRPEGYAIQRVYTGKDSPLQLAGLGFDVGLIVRNDDVVLVPEGYHPVSSPPGYTAYYLNILAGSDQVLNSADDPDFSWVKNTYSTIDPRLPIYPVDQT
jgi:5-deoxy-glucuronate isomerase